MIFVVAHKFTFATVRLKYFLFFLLSSFLHPLHAQTLIRGEVVDFANNGFLANVNVRNIYTLKGMTIGADGKFEIEVKKGELIELSKLGYKTLRIRITSEKEPSYYKLVMSKAPIQLREVDIKGKQLDFTSDSVEYRKTYEVVLRKERKEEVNIMALPLAMLSKKNREEWAFQKMYDAWEREKFIDYTFNEKLVNKITYLEGEDLKYFMNNFRPSYEFLRSASTYEYLSYIKYCYNLFSRTRKTN